MSACADRLAILGALADGELDAGNAVAMEEHLQSCEGCRAHLTGIADLKAALSRGSLRYAAPPTLRPRLVGRLGGVGPAISGVRRPGLATLPQWLTGGAITALAAAVVLVIMPRFTLPDLSAQLVDGHIRSLQAQHLVDVQTSDRHVVKPWFNGRINFAPPVVDMADAGFPLVGGRLDVIDARTVAALVYRRRAHVINLFVWSGETALPTLVGHRRGYSLLRWSRAGLVYWAVSDIDSAELEAFHTAFAARTAG